VGALRDLAVRTETLTVLPIKGRVPATKSTSAIVAQHIELQSFRRRIKVRTASEVKKRGSGTGVRVLC